MKNAKCKLLFMLEILFQYGTLTIRTFNIFLAFGFVFTGVFLIKYANRRMMSLGFMASNFLILAIAALLFGRIFYVVENWSYFENNLSFILYLWDLKFSVFGLIYGFVASLFLVSKNASQDYWAWIDASAFAFLLLMTFVHIGHFFNGTAYGLITSMPWGIALDNVNIPFVKPIHPTQLYSAAISASLLSYGIKKGKRIHISGVVGTRIIMLYSVGMLGIDFLHGAPSLYTKVSYVILATLALVSMIHCSHRTHADTNY